MLKRLHKSNRAYSLVELVIVMAMIAVLATMSLVSLTLISSARAKQASVVFGGEVNAIKKKCMTMKPSGDEYDFYALSVYLDESGTYNLCTVMHNKDTGEFEYVDEDNVSVSSRVEIRFCGKMRNFSDKEAWLDTAEADQYYDYPYDSLYLSDLKSGGSKDGPIFICFDRRGNCFSGTGDYYFYKKNGDYMARVKINQNGSIDVR